MKKYEIEYWEKESVWCRRTAIVKSNKDPKDMNYAEKMDLIEGEGGIDFIDSDYNWETSETIDYDFKTDFEAKEVE